MTNPSPRPALRKAADADVHPAAPRPARSARPRQVDPVPAPAPRPAAPAPAPVPAAPAPAAAPRSNGRAFSGATSDTLRVPDVAGTVAPSRTALDALFATEAPAPKAKRHREPEPVDLMGGKQVDLEARVPKALRKAARAEAKRRGLDVDAVVTDLLHGWVTGRS